MHSEDKYDSYPAPSSLRKVAGGVLASSFVIARSRAKRDEAIHLDGSPRLASQPRDDRADQDISDGVGAG
jgi:hypothetical protein